MEEQQHLGQGVRSAGFWAGVSPQVLRIRGVGTQQGPSKVWPSRECEVMVSPQGSKSDPELPCTTCPALVALAGLWSHMPLSCELNLSPASTWALSLDR